MSLPYPDSKVRK